MKPNTLFSAVVVLFVVIPTLGRAAGPTDETQLRNIEQDWINAIVKRDGAFLMKLETDDYTFTGPDGIVLDKQGDIKNVTTGDTVFDDLKIDSVKIRFYGDTAVVNGAGTVQAHAKDQDLGGPYTWTDVFVKRGGEWKAVAAHVTPVAKK